MIGRAEVKAHTSSVRLVRSYPYGPPQATPIAIQICKFGLTLQ